MTKVWILVNEPYHENSKIIGAFTEVDLAIKLFDELAATNQFDECLTLYCYEGDKSLQNVSAGNWCTVPKERHRRPLWTNYSDGSFRGVDVVVEDWSKMNWEKGYNQ